MEINSWFIPRVMSKSEFTKEISKRDSVSKDGHFNISYCIKCKKAHERVWEDNRSQLKYYEEFPSFKLKRKNCIKCKDKD